AGRGLTGRAQVRHLRALGRRDVEDRRGDRAERDVRRLQLEDGGAIAAGVDRGPERGAVDGIPGELGASEEAAVVLRRDAHGVGGPAGGGGGGGGACDGGRGG